MHNLDSNIYINCNKMPSVSCDMSFDVDRMSEEMKLNVRQMFQVQQRREERGGEGREQTQTCQKAG